MTFSIAARCARTGEFGIAVSSSSPAVAARCAHARAGVGAVATQNITDPTLGPKGLDLMAGGMSAGEALAELRATAAHIEYRQLALVDRLGGTASASGSRTLGTHRTVEGPGVVAAGNLLRSPEVPARMVAEFVALADRPLGERLVRAMQAGVAAGGDVAWPVADLRVDWHDTDPIGALADLWALWTPQMDAYVTRALNPSTAPAYGVPGDPGEAA